MDEGKPAKASGYAILDDQGIEVSTVGPTRRSAIVYWLTNGRLNPNRIEVGNGDGDADVEAAWARRSRVPGFRLAEVVAIEITEVGRG